MLNFPRDELKHNPMWSREWEAKLLAIEISNFERNEIIPSFFLQNILMKKFLL